MSFITKDPKDERIAELEAEWRKALIEYGKLEHRAETYKNQNDCYLALLGLRNRIDRLEWLLYPSELINVNNRMLKWKLLLEVRRKHPVVKQLRDRIIKIRLSIDEFVTQLSLLCPSYSESEITETEVPVRKWKGKIYTEEELKHMLEENKDILDEFEMNIIQVLYEKLELINTAEGEIVDRSFKYIRLKIPSGSDEEMETKIKTCFRGNKSIVAVSKLKDCVYLVEFENINEAISAFLNHEAYIDNQIVHFSISNNTDGGDN